MQVGFLVNFALFHGDLRYNLYLLPLSFVSWLFRFLDYYFFKFVSENSLACREQLIIKCDQFPNTQKSYYTMSLNSLKFSLSQIALNPGADDTILPHLIELWIICAKFDVIITKYKRKLIYLTYLTFMLRLIIWFSLTYTFYYDTAMGSEAILTMVKRVGQMSTRGYATQTFKLKKVITRERSGRDLGHYLYSYYYS